MTRGQLAHRDCGADLRHSAEMTSREPLRLHNLRLPFAIRLTAHRGDHRLAGSRRTGVLDEGASFDLPAYQTVHYEGPVIADGRAGHRLHLLINEDMAPVQGGPVGDVQMKLPIRLAQAVFLDPGAHWTLGYTAQYLGMTSRALATQLFRESRALMPIVREQRLMRVLLAVLEAPPGQLDIGKLAAASGFAPHTRFESLFSQHFGCRAGQLAKRAWSPSLTWSAGDLSSLG